MNTNDLPPAARLACLIEAGVAANPDLKHGRCLLLSGDRACAIAFAKLGAGLPRERMEHTDVTQVTGVPEAIWRAVTRMNDETDASLSDICLSLREGELAKVAA